MGWKAQYEGDFPTLGFAVIDWIETFLSAPDSVGFKPLVLTREQQEFILKFYELDKTTGKRKIRRGILVRPKGWGKSPFSAALACAEGLAPVLFDGWDADGQPVGKPWRSARTPLVQIAALSEEQADNAWLPVLEMLRNGAALDEYSGLEPMESFVKLPSGGKITKVTSSYRAREGDRPVFVVLDQTESWMSGNGGRNLAKTLRRGLGKTGGSSLETPNCWIPGEGSVAESSGLYGQLLAEGKKLEPGVLFDQRSAPAETELGNKKSLLRGLAIAYGDSADLAQCRVHSPPCKAQSGWTRGWVDLERVRAEIFDPDNDVEDSRRFYLNQVWAASTAWLAAPEVERAVCTDAPILEGDLITVGFDGSRRRTRGVTDTTALVGCRVRDGKLFLIRAWEQPEGQAGENWTVPVNQVDAEVREMFRKYSVAGMFCDPAKWETWVAKWEAEHGKNLQVKASRDKPLTWWMTGGRSSLIVRAVSQLENAIIEGEAKLDDSPLLMRHLLNAHRRVTRSGIQIYKASPESHNKIDAAIAAILAWQARVAALAAGATNKREDVWIKVR